MPEPRFLCDNWSCPAKWSCKRFWGRAEAYWGMRHDHPPLRTIVLEAGAEACELYERDEARAWLAGVFGPWGAPAVADSGKEWPYVYRWDRCGRKGRRCRITARGALNSCRVEFPDGFVMVTSRNALRRFAPAAAPAPDSAPGSGRRPTSRPAGSPRR